MGAIANHGKAAVPRLLKPSSLADIINLEKLDLEGLGLDSITKSEDVSLLDASTANTLKGMMKYNVEKTYGVWTFSGLDVGGKTGTGEVDDKDSNATFAGFLDDPDHPYAFVVCVENAGGGQAIAAPIANAVLQALTESDW